jgi:uncharacterized membrane protein YfcA
MYLKLIDKNIYKLIFIGLITGMVASVVGGGAEILIVPLLIYLKIFTDHKKAIATSLASLLLPIGIVAVYFYSKTNCIEGKCINWKYAMIISMCFVLGSSLSYFTSRIQTKYLKILFGIISIILGGVIISEEL